MRRPLEVAFVNENTMGHASYLLPFARTLADTPALGIVPHRIDATPMPPGTKRWAEASVPGLRRWGLDFGVARWRRGASRHVRHELDALMARQRIDAVVVNTQSVALDLLDVAERLPLFVCLDATFAQLARTPWFGPNRASRLLHPLTLAPLMARERRLLQRAHRLLPWSSPVADSLVAEYGIPPERILPLPPSVDSNAAVAAREGGGVPRILFIGGDFARKGGPLLLEAFRERFADRCELHLVTNADLPATRNVHVHRGVAAYSPEWLALWRSADVFVFPSAMETFGIVLLEALAFQVPVVAADAGAARDVLDDGRAGLLLPALTAGAIAEAIEQVLAHPEAARARAEAGLARLRGRYDLAANAARLAEALHAARPPGQDG